MEKFDERGREIPDQTPVEMPAGASKPESMQDMIARLVRSQVNAVAADSGFGSWEEEDDFDDPEERVIDPHSEHYIQDAEMNPFQTASDTLDGVVDSEGSGRGSAGDNSTSGARARQDGAEGPQDNSDGDAEQGVHT